MFVFTKRERERERVICYVLIREAGKGTEKWDWGFSS